MREKPLLINLRYGDGPEQESAAVKRYIIEFSVPETIGLDNDRVIRVIGIYQEHGGQWAADVEVEHRGKREVRQATATYHKNSIRELKGDTESM